MNDDYIDDIELNEEASDTNYKCPGCHGCMDCLNITWNDFL